MAWHGTAWNESTGELFSQVQGQNVNILASVYSYGTANDPVGVHVHVGTSYPGWVSSTRVSHGVSSSDA